MFAFLMILLLPSIITHTIWLMGGKGLPYILTSRWDIAFVNIIFFCLFLAMLRYRTRVDWRSRNVYVAFIIALFAEMYGFPLTAYFVANYFGAIDVDYQPAYAMGIKFMGVHFTLPTMMIVGGAFTVIGLLLIVTGWYEIYRKKEGLVTSGIYKYSRNPQYVGMIMVAFGWILHWPTLLTILMFPVLVITYYRLSRDEEALMQRLYPGDFERFKAKIPMFL